MRKKGEKNAIAWQNLFIFLRKTLQIHFLASLNNFYVCVQILFLKAWEKQMSLWNSKVRRRQCWLVKPVWSLPKRFTMMQLPKKDIVAAYCNILCILEKKKGEWIRTLWYLNFWKKSDILNSFWNESTCKDLNKMIPSLC